MGGAVIFTPQYGDSRMKYIAAGVLNPFQHKILRRAYKRILRARFNIREH
jgi:hypothetical protein